MLCAASYPPLQRTQGRIMAWTFHAALCRAATIVLLGLTTIAVPIYAQQPATNWAGVVRTASGQLVAGAKVTVSSTQENQQTVVTGNNGQFAVEVLASGPHTVTVQLAGRVPTAPVEVDIAHAPVVLRITRENVLSVEANPQITSSVSDAAGGTS